jgi:hypothetical protein
MISSDIIIPGVEYLGAISAFEKWGEALLSKNPKQVALTYTEDATLIPTMKNDVRVGRGKIRNYFRHFLKINPEVFLDEAYFSKLEDSFIQMVGIYSFRTKDRVVQGRVSMIFKKCDSDEWKIFHHHSSQFV